MHTQTRVNVINELFFGKFRLIVTFHREHEFNLYHTTQTQTTYGLMVNGMK